MADRSNDDDTDDDETKNDDNKEDHGHDDYHNDEPRRGMTTAASLAVLRWDPTTKDASAWLKHRDVQDFLENHTPDSADNEFNESTLQGLFLSAGKAIATSGRRGAETRVMAFAGWLTLDKVHDGWEGSLPCAVYKEAVNATGLLGDSTAGSTSTSATLTSKGPLKPDIQIYIKSLPSSHLSWVSELKLVPYSQLARADAWEKKHKAGLSQAVWYTWAGHELCGARGGLVLINGMYQRLWVTSREQDQPCDEDQDEGGSGDASHNVSDHPAAAQVENASKNRERTETEDHPMLPEQEEDDAARSCNDRNSPSDRSTKPVKVLLVEVPVSMASGTIRTSFTGYNFGRESLPNSLPRTVSTVSNTSEELDKASVRLFETLVLALRIAESRALTEPCAGPGAAGGGVVFGGPAGGGQGEDLAEIGNGATWPSWDLLTSADAMTNVVHNVPTSERARTKLEKRRKEDMEKELNMAETEVGESGDAEGGGAVGGEQGGGQGGSGVGGGSSFRGPATRGAESSGGSGLNAMLRGGAVNAGLRALHQQCVHDWLGRQDDEVDIPEPGDRWVSKAGDDAGDDDEMTSISQRIHDDPPFMEINRLAKVMSRYGWGFRFVSPDEVDVAMRKAVGGDGQNGGRGLMM